MRNEAISYLREGTLFTGVLEYPELWCFIFNPNYIVINMDDKSFNGQMVVVLSSGDKSYEIYVNLFKGTTKVFISKILQLLLDDVEHFRTRVVTITVLDNGTPITRSLICCIAVWGNIQIGEQFGKYGAFVFNGKDYSHVRNVVWFKNFPFYVSMFRAEYGELISASSDYTDPSNGERKIFRCHIDSITTGSLPLFDGMFSKYLSSPGIVLNTSNGTIYAIHERKYYRFWTSSGILGSVYDYNDSSLSVRDDVEFEYKGEIVRWNKETKQLDRSTMGNAGTEGIFELNPALTFPDAKEKASYNICLEKVTSGIFNMNFNLPFPDMTRVVNETVNIHISNRKDGLYLRWIDRFGIMQFYLFIEGESSIKSKASSSAIQVERTFSGVNFGNFERSIDTTNTETRKCCAVDLTKDVLEYVKTIVSSPIVDLFVGKNKAGTELWLPVSVSDGTYKTNPKTLLSDYEISIQMPEISSQTL